jgi:hypothetical protein
MKQIHSIHSLFINKKTKTKQTSDDHKQPNKLNTEKVLRSTGAAAAMAATHLLCNPRLADPPLLNSTFFSGSSSSCNGVNDNNNNNHNNNNNSIISHSAIAHPREWPSTTSPTTTTTSVDVDLNRQTDPLGEPIYEPATLGRLIRNNFLRTSFDNY